MDANAHYSYAEKLMTMNTVIFSNLPIPPSSNNQYCMKKIGGRIRHIRSRELREFRDQMAKYAQQHAEQVLLSRQLVAQWLKTSRPLEIECVFFFHRHRLISKQNKFKKLDVSNRLKAAHDCIAEMLGIDDSAFFRVVGEKALCHDTLNEHFCFEIVQGEGV